VHSSGKAIGGSSAINFGTYARRQTADYDDWAKLGNNGWDFKGLLPYFKKHEHFDGPTEDSPYQDKYELDFHGHDGPIHTALPTWRPTQGNAWMETCEKIGKRMGSPKDAWSGDHLGTYSSLATIDRSPGPFNGTRSYATTGYLIPNAGRPNLHVLVEALVLKLSLRQDCSVTGVEFQHSGNIHKVSVKKEVILSAGTIKSPQVLELSGIGAPEILSKAGIKCLAENKQVGENFQDTLSQASCTSLRQENYQWTRSKMSKKCEKPWPSTVPQKTASSPAAGPEIALQAMQHYPLMRRSLLSRNLSSRLDLPTQHSEIAKGLLADALASPDDASVHIAYIAATINLDAFPSQSGMLKPPASMKGKQGISFSIAAQRPLSVGSCHILTNNPEDDPGIDPAYLSHPADLEVLAKGIELAEKMRATSPFKEKIERRIFPPESVNFGVKKEREEYLRSAVTTQYHPIGTVSMGPKGQGACDNRLRVRGCRNVRVVDASIIPLHVSGNIVSAVYAIAEKGADLIKEDWGL
jgi:choline dehydrogenase-like flavoprotein